MTKQTLLKSMYLLGKAFPQFKDHEDKELLIMWNDLFKDEDELLFQSAVKKLIATFQYQKPTMGNLNAILADMKDVERLDPGDIHDEIIKVIRKFGSYRVDEAYESLSPVARKTVDNLGGLKTLCLSETLMVDRAHCLQVAQANIDRRKQDLLNTNSMKKEQIENKKKVLELVEKIGGNDD